MAMGGKRPKGNMEAVLLVFREKKKERSKGSSRGQMTGPPPRTPIMCVCFELGLPTNNRSIL
jgi:hypothetical protein